MQLDDTKEKVYIYNLDQELSEIESEEEKVVFLPEIEKKLGKIPRSVLTSKGQPVTSNELILYNVPSSLSVPREQDNVRRAIIETRARAREKQMQESTESQLMGSNDVWPNNQFNGHRTDSGKMDFESDDGDDDDAMDIE